MDSKRLNDWLQVIGLFGVLGGLIFVGLQLRLDRQAAQAGAADAALGVRQSWAELLTNNSVVWAKGLAGEPLSFEESLEFSELADVFSFRYFVSQFRASQLGNTEVERFAPELAAEIHRHPGLRRWWDETRDKRIEQRQRLGRSESAWSVAVTEELARLSAEEARE